MKHIAYLMICGLLLISSISQAQTPSAEDAWSVWFYNWDLDRMARTIPATGETEFFTIQSFETFRYWDRYDSFTPNIAVASETRRIAYCSVGVHDICADSGERSALVIYNLENETVENAVCLPANSSCYITPNSWSPDETQLVYAIDYLDTPSEPEWEVRMLDTEQANADSLGTILLDHTTPGFESEERLWHGCIFPHIYAFQPDQWIFGVLICEAQGGGPSHDFFWTPQPNSAVLLPNPSVFEDYLAATDEAFWLEHDGSCADDNYPGCQPASLHYRQDKGQPSVLYESTQLRPGTVRLIENGNKLLFSLHDSFELGEHPPLPLGKPLFRVILERDGSVQTFPVETLLNGAQDIVGTPTGMLYVVGVVDDPDRGIGQSRVYEQSTLDLTSPPRLIWTDDSPDWHILYADPLLPAPDLPPFQPIQGELP